MAEPQKKNLKEKAAEEVRLMMIIAAYLAAFFIAFLTYRRLISREFGVTSFHYGFALIEALVIAKVILIGKALGLGQKHTGRVLAMRVLRVSVIYAILVGIFSVLEHAIEGLIHHKTFAESLQELASQGKWEILGKTLVIFVAFIPFFALWELDASLGDRKLVQIFFRKGPIQEGS
jgi:hypothetical protein